jgi:hypothetical protein
MRELGLHRLLVIGLIFGLSLGCSQGTRNSSPAAASLRPASAPEPGLAQNPRNLIEMRESPYNNIYVYREGTNLCMTFGCNQKLYTETIYNTLDDRDLPAPYTRFMTASLIYPRQVKSILEIGIPPWPTCHASILACGRKRTSIWSRGMAGSSWRARRPNTT